MSNKTAIACLTSTLRHVVLVIV